MDTERNADQTEKAEKQKKLPEEIEGKKKGKQDKKNAPKRREKT